MSKVPREDADETDTRMSPDPFAAVLPALAALGAVASIAAINWSGEGKLATRTRTKRKTSAAVRDLETCCIGLVEIFRRFQRHPRVFAGEGGQASAPLKFGVHGQRIRADAQRLYLQLMNDIASMLVLAAQNAFDVMTAIEDGDIDAPEEIFFGFGEQQERLNEIIQSRVPLRVAVDTGAEIADQLTALVRELKKHQKAG
ncbi:hypothetical protein [Hyphomicrobium facile]|uniref:Uncharacterized protein n=1 Tax=Hyphomicrobium facile TaxID=51670 RepID=A0A1I7NST8_9HYPH|nr:hypothetical protein [Hyphomicrobium facile]SFV37685.1 hypothetical protein SAMN04488557_3288 [Hyphomicrobium facile]